ncbi:MAG: hypothetical protein NZM09_05315 [Ignavibacterium sp.]|nr:hypothetical protein [Ignavibacterium sp.]MDW8375095.1 hypothetical protein [Ignavibacteriales bacterium]
MKNNIILWISAFAIVFVVSYLKSIFSENYPITGTIGIEGKKLSYKLDKEGFGDKHKLLLRSDNENVSAFVVVKNDSSFKIDFHKENIFLAAELNRKVTDKEFSYHLIVRNQQNEFRIPQNGEVNFIFYGKISKMLAWMFNIFLFVGMILIVRSGLEYFNKNKLTKKLLVLAGVVWLTFVMLINPLYLSYKYEYINHIITPIQNLFPINDLLILVLLIITVVMSFNKRFQDKPVSLVFSVVALILYYFN